ncbi:MAG: flagellar biosynthesis protein FlhB [Desulfamplus sp.]|nr:flagellar biosynthesis protein FlhB [Desulfamplus sp.]
MAEAPGGGGEKTEDASARKLTKAREQGQVAKSMEIPSVFVLLAGVLALRAFASMIYNNCLAMMDDTLRFEGVPILTDSEVINLFFRYSEIMFLMLIPILAAVFFAAAASNLFQVGFHISWEALEPKLSKINPLAGLMRIFSSRSLIELVKSVLKLVIVFAVAYIAVKGEIDNIIRLYDNSISFILLYIMELSFNIVIKILLVMAIIAILDYAYQKWQFLEDQKMTKQEVKEEFKQTEGDPQIKSKIRQIQAQAARQRMMADVPKADVVVTNPTRLAVAIKYDGATMEAPTVLAKGAGAVAANIRRIAEEAGVPLVENKELARNLYSMVEVGQTVPPDLFQAVAELLAYVYKLKGKRI